MATASGEWTLTGRDGELAVLDTVGAPGGPGVLVIDGAPGVGRTRLARAALAAAGTAGRSAAWATGTAAVRAVPLGALAHLLRPEPDLPTDPLALLHRALADLGPAGTLVVDDAHLLDDLSVTVLQQLAARGSVALVVTTRDGAAGDRLAPLWTDGAATRIELAPLGRADTERLLGTVLAGPVDPDTVERLWRLTRGHPRYLRELVTDGRRSGDMERRGGCWCWPGDICPSRRLTDLVLAGLGPLDAPERAALEAVAATEPVLLQRLAGLVDLDALAALERRGVLLVDGRGLATSAHPLHAAAVRAATPWARSARLRAPVADAEALVAAAQEANGRLDHGRAEELARSALDAGGGPDAHRELVEAVRWRGTPSEVVAAVDAARSTELDPDVAAHLAVVAATALAHGAARCADAERTLAGVSPASAAAVARVRAAAALVAGLDGRPRASLELAGPVSDGPAAVLAAAATTAALAVTGQAAESLRAARSGWAARPPGPGHAPFDALLLGRAELLALRLAGHSQELAERAVELHRLAAGPSGPGTPDWAGEPIAALHRGQAALELGDLPVAGRWLAEALVGLRHRDPAGLRPECAADLARVRALLGAADEAAELLAVAEVGPTGGRSLALARAWQASAAGQRGSALRDVRSAADRAAECGEHATEAELRHTAAMLDGAAEEAGRLGELAALTGSPVVGVWAGYAAAVTSVDGHRLDAIATEFERRGARLLAADAAAAAAAAHHQRGDRRRTARSGAVAARLAGWCGGPHTPALRRLDPPRLTGRERQVAELVTDGLSNAAIADKLVVSVRTVETHLAHAYAKLGVPDRSGLADVLRPVS